MPKIDSRVVEVSVVILTRNGEEYLEEVLTAVLGQVTEFVFEVVVIDSGSTDGTQNIIRKFIDLGDKQLRFIQIKPSEFNHGETRNRGVREAEGDYVAFLTQDATPISTGWLQSLRDSFDLDPKIAAVFGKHIPRPGCNPITKRDIDGVFLNISPQDTAVIQELKTADDRAAVDAGTSPLLFYSDVNSCVRRSYWEQNPYPRIDYAEDQVFGKTVLLAGYKKVYCPQAAVYHSHDYRPGTFFRRYFDEYKGLNEAVGYTEATGFWLLLPLAIRGTWADMKMIRASQDRGSKGLLYWCYYAWSMNIARRLGAYLGSRHNRLPLFIGKRLSLEDGKNETSR